MKPVYRSAVAVLIAIAITCFSWSTGPGLASAARHLTFRQTSGPARNASVVLRREAERLRHAMLPLLRVMNHPILPQQVRIRIADDPSINAASAGNGEFLVTTGLLQRASDDQLRGVLAHEIAHDDLGHAAKAQVLGTGLGLGVILLEQLLPGSGSITPIAGALIARNYSRPQEYEADRHAMRILNRAGYSKGVLIEALTWLMEHDGDSGGGILSTHPATSERIQALRAIR